MKEDIKNEWLAELRSGEWLQGAARLKKVDESNGETRHCCLGILCEIAKRHGVAAEEDMGNGVMFKTHELSDDSYEFLPIGVRNWAGLSEADPWIGSVEKRLSSLNDEGFDFPAIATFIEEEL
jgi:hypothetical protein